MKKKFILITSFLLLFVFNISIVSANPVADRVNKIANGSDETFYHSQSLRYSTTHTHQYLTARALSILTDDKGYDISKPLYDYCDILLKGSDSPDIDENSGYTFMHHFYDPHTDTGLFNTKITAKTKFIEHTNKALKLYKEDKEASIEELGRALHYLEDINQPFHAANLTVLTSNHYSFEEYVDKNRSLFKATTNNQYDLYKNLIFEEYLNQIAYDCAINSYQYVDILKDKKTFYTVSMELIPYTQKQAANFLYRFIKEANKN